MTIQPQQLKQKNQSVAGDKPKLIAIPGAWRHKVERSASVVESFFHAFRGFAHAFKTERNVRIHVCLAVVVTVLAILLRVDVTGCAILALAIGIVLTAELINTALERLVDLATNNEYHRIARLAKDTAAAAVMCSAIMTTVVGALIFVPRLWALWSMK